MMPPNEVGPRETIPGGPDTITNTSDHHEAGSSDCTATGRPPWPQESHADLGLVEDPHAVGGDA